MILFIAALTGVGVYLLSIWLFASAKQKRINRRLNSGSLVVVNKEKGIVVTLKRLSVKVGVKIGEMQYPAIKKYLSDINKLIATAGLANIGDQTFTGMQVIAGLGGIALGLVLFNSFDIFLLLVLFAIGFFMPYLWLKDKISKKQRAIFRSLPDALDLLTLLVEAGVDFNSAINILIENEKNTLTTELYLYQQEVKLGKNRITALLDLSARIDNKYLSSVISSITQALQTGSPVSATLKMLSEQFRSERSIMAEKLGAQAPVKMMIPLILLIFPTIFIVIFAPIVLSFLGGGF
ncbi:MAG: type II secretion system F family protein [Elusimicrobia bacterium]|nr:type II secretion system F family protein [Elusimicrobiota bacterium]MBU2615365.1 type II secretion system F family protein [Elusimicrobiota bacterium]